MPVTKTTTDLPQINFSRMIGYYTRDFRAAQVTAATDYLVLICLNADLPGELGRNQADVCHEALRELVLETREFAQLLGDMLANGQKVEGALGKRARLIKLPERGDYLRAVTTQAASVADTNSRTTDAVLLYHLAGDYNNVLVVINRAMADSITVDPGNDPQPLQLLRPRDAGQGREQASPSGAPGSTLSLAGVNDPFVLSSHFSKLYFGDAEHSPKIDPNTRAINDTLMKLDEARGSFRDEDWKNVFIVSDLTHSAHTAWWSRPLLTLQPVDPKCHWTSSSSSRRAHTPYPRLRLEDLCHLAPHCSPCRPNALLGLSRHQRASRAANGANGGLCDRDSHPDPRSPGAAGEGLDGLRGNDETAHAEKLLGGDCARGERQWNGDVGAGLQQTACNA